MTWQWKVWPLKILKEVFSAVQHDPEQILWSYKRYAKKAFAFQASECDLNGLKIKSNSTEIIQLHQCENEIRDQNQDLYTVTF